MNRPRRLRRAHRRAAESFDATDFFHRDVRGRLLDRLQWVRLEPAWILDLGAGTGQALAGLATRFPAARLLALDHAAPLLAAGRRAGRIEPPAWAVCADAGRLPLADGGMDLVFSSLALAYCRDPTPALAEARRVLRSPGLFSFATLGRASLQELGACWAAADAHAHVAPFIDMHDLGDLLVHAGFAEPVLDVDTITVTYEHLDRLVSDLRAAGAVNLAAGRNRGLTGRGAARRLRRAWADRRGPDGRVGVTLEVIFGQAWAGGAGRARDDASGEVSIPVASVSRRPRDG